MMNPMKKICAILFVLLTVCRVEAQTLPEGDNFKFGLKVGLSGSTLLGDELKNPRPRFGYLAGIYYKQRIKNNWSIYSELTGNVRGSNFKNGADGYSGIHLFTIEMPLTLVYQFKENHNVSIGPQVSWITASSLFVGSNRKTALDGLGFKPIDFGLSAFYTRSYEVVSIQTGVNIGYRNINRNINFENIKPETGNGGIVRILSFDVAFIF
jgi:hypothetical protein